VYGNRYFEIQHGPYTPNQRRAIASHEIGHLQLIGHIPQNYQPMALMYPSNGLDEFEDLNRPTQDDIAIVKRAYP